VETVEDVTHWNFPKLHLMMHIFDAGAALWLPQAVVNQDW
jgi:hypothetical protein